MGERDNRTLKRIFDFGIWPNLLKARPEEYQSYMDLDRPRKNFLPLVEKNALNRESPVRYYLWFWYVYMFRDKNHRI